ncbi:MAG TPA: FAD-dependent oxidoreductase [Methanomicrobiales archaeon]|nr:FAD-dependent oxidoreductase [Methanomicrobiales archaeon]
MPEIRVYTTKNCPYCRMVKAFLDKHGIPYQNIDVGEDREAAREMVRLTNQYAVPVTMVDDKIIIGFDAPLLNKIFGTEKTGELYDVMILGAGPAGLTAAVYTARKLLKTIVISETIGGQALESWTIENYMGYRIVTGEDLMKKFEEQARGLHIHIELDGVESIKEDGGIFFVDTASEQTFRARSLIIATGSRPKWLDLENERKFTGHGVSVCATCDAPLYQNKDVAVVGGGNSALTTAIEMANIARSVHLVVRSAIRADKVYEEMLKEKKNLTVHLDAEITALQGEQFLSGITLKNRSSGAETNLAIEGLFLQIGHDANTGFLDGFLDMNDHKEIIIDINSHTSREGVFAAGDVTNVKNKQIIIASGEGAKAALAAHEYLLKK